MHRNGQRIHGPLIGLLIACLTSNNANAAEPINLPQKIACSAKAAKTVKGLPQVRDPGGQLTEPQQLKFKREWEAAQVREAKLWEACWSVEDMKALGEANFLLPWAESICGGRRTKSYTKAFEVTGNAHIAEFALSEESTRKANGDRMHDLTANKREAEASRFCSGIADAFGPKGGKWPGLYIP